MPYDTESQSRNVLASPLGEEGHEVAKGVQANWIHRGAPRPANPVRRHPAKSVCMRVRMIMILDVDVTAERRHYNTHRPLKGKRLTTFCASLALLQNVFAVHRKGDTATLGAKGPVKPKNPWAEGPSILRTFSTTLLHNPRRQPRPPFYKTCGVSRHHHPLNLLNLLNPGRSAAP